MQVLKSTLTIDIYDPWVDTKASLPILKELIKDKKYDAIILAVSHDCFNELPIKDMITEKGVVYDIKSVLPKELVDERL